MLQFKKMSLGKLTSWQRLAFLALVAISGVFVLAGFTNPHVTIAVGLFSNIVAAAFGQKLVEWVDDGSVYLPANKERATKSETIRIVPPPRGTDAVTALDVAATNIYSLFSINFAAAVLLISLVQLEHAKILSFTDLGYIDAQKYIIGSLVIFILLPAMTFISMIMGSSRRPLSFVAFIVGIALSLPFYFITAGAVGLHTGFGNAAQVSLSLGTSLPLVPGYSGFKITAVLIQLSTLIAIGFCEASYAWMVAHVSRFVLRQLNHLVTNRV